MRSEVPPSDNLYITDLPVGLDDSGLREVFSAYGTIAQCRVLPNSGSGQGKCAGLVRFATQSEATWVVENVDGNIPHGLTEPIGCRYADTPEVKAARQAKGGGGKSSPYGGKGTEASWKGSGWSDGGKGGGWSDGGKGSGWSDGGKGWSDGGKGGWSDGGKGCMESGWKGGWSDGGCAYGPIKGKGGGKKGSKNCAISIKELHDGLLESKCLPGGSSYVNDENALYIANLPLDTTDADLYRIFAPFGAIAPQGVRAMLSRDGSCRGFGFVNFLEPLGCEAAVQTLNGTWMPDGTTLIVKIKTPGKGDSKGKGERPVPASAVEAE